MDTSHEYASDDVTPAKTRPKLFSMAQSHALLESKRFNPPEQQNVLNTARIRMDPGQRQRKGAAQTAPRISLSHLLSNNIQTRTTTPVSAHRSSAQAYTIERHDTENVNSSPPFSSYGSPERACIQQNRPFSAAPNPQHTLRLSSLYKAPETLRKSQNPNDASALLISSVSTNKSQSTIRKDDFVQYFGSTVVENEQLRAAKQHLEAMNNQLSRELEDYRSNLSVINDQLSSATLEVKTMRPALALAREQLSSNETEIASLKESCSSIKAEVDNVREENKALKEEHTRERIENDRLLTSVQTTKNGIAKLLIERVFMIYVGSMINVT
ncbi:hypothetical protein BDN70DRAFT_132046 [Pholiota conissans]|uniref:Uncharacterized protein n=1 Tax=Pholiota conissans TaxID=109636 RepID=A0A9P5YYN0_9AGAR|nr:hypothetical protein BDN70DRAFT_132046 [Pholiota conissans]